MAKSPVYDDAVWRAYSEEARRERDQAWREREEAYEREREQERRDREWDRRMDTNFTIFAWVLGFLTGGIVVMLIWIIERLS